MAIELSSIVGQGAGSLCAEVDGEMVMMSVEEGNYYGLDEIGSRIWQLLAEPVSVAALCEKLREEFAVDRETCEADVLKFLNQLEAQHLIQLHP